MAGRIKNLSRGRAGVGKHATPLGNFNPTKLGHPSALSPGVKTLMAKGIPMKQAIGMGVKGGGNAKVTSKNWHQPGKQGC